VAADAEEKGAIMDSNIPTYPDLAGKVAVVTGSSRGIGAATCRLLAANGAKVVVNGRDQAALEQTVQQLRAAGGEATAVAADVAEPGGLQRLREQTERTYGPAEVLGAFVGSGGPPPGPTAELTEQGWDAAIRGNLTVTFLTIKAFLPGMVERRRGAIVTLASTAARFAGGERIGAPTGYAVAKAGVVRLTCVSPATIMTERLQRMVPADRKTQMTAMYPIGRLGTPEDVACAVLFLASDCASWITGVTLDVAGGQVMR
jgi:3-oxoacyl-[acyl-carrier protein] reductase